jgi:hypothetical protein
MAIGMLRCSMLKDWASKITEMVGTVNNWIKAESGLVTSCFSVCVSLVAGCAAIYAVWQCSYLVQYYMRVIKTACSVVQAAKLYIFNFTD